MDAQSYTAQERRAANQVWAAAGAYGFEPLFLARNTDGTIDFYMNCIVGLVHKYYGDALIRDIFSAWEGDTRQPMLDDMAWLYLENAAYRLELPRAGKFSPEQARALRVPVQQWKLLQKGQSVAVEGRTVQPAQVLGAPRKGLSVVFSGDTAPCPYYLQAAHDADLLICDATYALPEQEDQARQWGHSTFGQSASLAAQARAKRLWLTHYSPMITDPEEYAAQAQSIFPAAECGFDGKSITLQYEEAQP